MIEKIVILLALVFLGERISSRLGQPSVLATVLVGIALGPSYLNMVTESEIELLAEMGAVLLLFVVGIESEVHEIFNKDNFLVAFGGVVAPFILGYFTSYLIPVANVWERVFLGIILVATSVGITAKLLQEMGLLNTKMGSTIIGAAVVDDILGIIVLSAGLASSSSGVLSMEPVLRTISISIVFIAVSVGIVGKLASKTLHLLESKFGMEFKEVAILPLFIIALSMAWISEAMGLSMIIGAFTAGIMLPLASHRREEIKRNIDPIYRLLVPFFFIVFGVMVDLKTSYSMLWFGIILTMAAILGKVIGCGLMAKLIGFRNVESVVIGLGMSPRGEVGLIIALVALQNGIIGEAVYAQAVLMSILTLIIPPLILKGQLSRL